MFSIGSTASVGWLNPRKCPISSVLDGFGWYIICFLISSGWFSHHTMINSNKTWQEPCFNSYQHVQVLRSTFCYSWFRIWPHLIALVLAIDLSVFPWGTFPTGWWCQPLCKIWVSWDDHSQQMEKVVPNHQPNVSLPKGNITLPEGISPLNHHWTTNFYWWVLWTPLKNMSQLGWLLLIIPNRWETSKNGNQTTNQYINLWFQTSAQ